MGLWKKIAGLFIGIGIVLSAGPVQAQQVQAINPFDESIWRVEHINSQKRMINQYQGALRYTYLTFNPYTHRVSGSGLCNKFYGHFQNNGNQVTITDFVAQDQTCLSSEVNQQDRRFFVYLTSIKTFSIAGNMLTLMDAQQKRLIIAKHVK